ncbi:MAG: hypothetical protein P8Y95_15860, partial [Gammaproteobacteria bacterium]
MIGVFVLQGWNLILLIPVALFLQALIDRKYPAMLAFVVFVIGLQVLDGAGYQHRLYQFGVPDAVYSGMNGWGHFLTPALYYGAYWTCFAAMLGIGAHLFWRRGLDDADRLRFSEARARLGKGALAGLGMCAFVMLGFGSWIFYNTNVLNEYRSTEDAERLQAEYEKRYGKYRALPMPEAVDMDVEVDIYPEERRLESRGTFVLENVRDAPLEELHLNVAAALTVNHLEVTRGELVESDPVHGFYRYRFDESLRPGERVRLTFDLSWRNRGFVNHGSSTRLIHNGTFVNNAEIMPVPGYDFSRELGDNNKRRKYGLPPAERLPPFGDPASYGVSQLRASTRSAFHAVLSTSEDQTAIAPGYLRKQWIANGRRYFEYAMDRPIWPFVSFMSA